MLRTLGRRRVRVIHGSAFVAAVLRVGIMVVGIVGGQRSLLLTLFNAGLFSVGHDVFVCVVVLKKGGVRVRVFVNLCKVRRLGKGLLGMCEVWCLDGTDMDGKVG